jgi:hypothetical protein
MTQQPIEPIKGADVLGQSDSGTGVEGISNSSTGVKGISTSGIGVEGASTSERAVFGNSISGVGVQGESDQSDGVKGISHSSQHAGVSAFNNGGGSALWAEGKTAGFFIGEVTHNGNVTVVKGDITLTNGDCAEEFDIAAIGEIEPGTVMVLNQQGAVQPSQQAYDKKVAGVISGAGDYKPGLILDKKGPSEGRMPVALVGKVYCKVDARYASIEVGDLLTTSPTPGYAMKADDPFKAFGAVIGKALRSLEAGQGLIPVLVALQ